MNIQVRKNQQLLLGAFCIVGFISTILWQVIFKNVSEITMFLAFFHIFLIALINESVFVYQLVKEGKTKAVKNSVYFIFAIFNFVFLGVLLLYTLLTYVLVA